MHKLNQWRSRRLVVLATLTLLGSAAAGARLRPADWSTSPLPLPVGLVSAPVRRIDLDVTLTAPGRVESTENTLIECELEQLRARASAGQIMRTSGLNTIIDVVPEGTLVKEGDLICRFDASECEEMIRQQRIVSETAKSDVLQARLDLEAAEINLKEYREGVRIQQYRTLEGQIALAKAEWQRQADRMEWAERLLPLGYISSSRHAQERQLLERAEIDLQRSRDALETYKRFTEAKLTQSLESVIARRISTLQYLENRLDREEEQLAHYEDQLEQCTIEAPHDGMLIYAQDDDDDPRIRIGSQVSYKMDLFVLPNLSKMEVQSYLSETAVRDVAKGMPARVRVESLPGREFEGRVSWVSSLPQDLGASWRRPDIRVYLARVELDRPAEMLPGMNAEVEIRTAARPDALVVPSQAVEMDRGASFCYVAGPDGLERRPVSVERGTIDLLQVTRGLSEGERVVLDPSGVEATGLEVVEAPEVTGPAPTDLAAGDSATASAEQSAPTR